MDQVWHALATSGPMALVLGAIVVKLWLKLEKKDERIDQIQEQRVKDQQGCEDRQRQAHVEVLNTMRELAGAMRKGKEL